MAARDRLEAIEKGIDETLAVAVHSAADASTGDRKIIMPLLFSPCCICCRGAIRILRPRDVPYVTRR